MKLIIGSLIVLICTVQGSHKFDESIKDLESTKFGRTLLETIQMQIETEDPVANLVDMLQNLDNKIDGQQKRDDERFERMSKSCEKDLSQLNDQIGQATTISMTLKLELDQLTPQKTMEVGNCKSHFHHSSFKQKENLQTELEYQTTRREKERQQYEQTLDELEETMFGVNNIKTFFNNYLDELVKNRRKFDRQPPSEDFLQKRAKFEDNEESEEDYEQATKILNLSQISQKMNKIKHSIKLEGYKYLFQIMSHITLDQSQKNDASVRLREAEILTRKMLVIIKQIDSFLQDQRTFEVKAEEARDQTFQDLKYMYTDQIVQAQTERNLLEGIVESLSSKITSGINEKFEVDTKIENKSKERDDIQTECTQSQEDYKAETNKRINERKAIAEALELITTKLGQLKKQMLAKAGG